MDEGRIETIRKIEEVPLRLAEGIIEGLSSKPGDFLVLGMGFYAGYMGYDVIQYIMRPFKEIASTVGGQVAALPNKVMDMSFDLANMPIEVGAGLTTGFADLLGIGFPGKRITPATKGEITTPGVSYYGPPPVGYTGEWPPLGITLAQVQAEIEKDNDDKAKWQLEQYWMELNLKVICGCLSALAAYTITRPGFVAGVLQGVGEISKGIGETIPF